MLAFPAAVINRLFHWHAWLLQKICQTNEVLNIPKAFLPTTGLR